MAGGVLTSIIYTWELSGINPFEYLIALQVYKNHIVKEPKAWLPWNYEITMLQITPQHRILLAVEPIDFRKGIDGLKALCMQKLFNDSFSGIVFACTNWMHTSVKLLVYHASGRPCPLGSLGSWLSSFDVLGTGSSGSVLFCSVFGDLSCCLVALYPLPKISRFKLDTVIICSTSALGI